MTWKAEVSDSAVQSTMVLREPIQTTENEGEKIFHTLHVATRLYTLPSAVAVPLQNTSRRHCLVRDDIKTLTGHQW